MIAPPTFRILVVDESPAVRLFVELAVGSDSVRVAGAADGYAALNSVEHACPDLVLAASGTTGFIGHDLAHKLADRQLPVVLMRGSLDPANGETGAIAGVIAKPLQTQQLRELVSQVANGRLSFPPLPEPARLPVRRTRLVEPVEPVEPVESALEADAPVDPIDAWMKGADEALGFTRPRWR
jgi:CheY-like chemotaxis protein